MNTTDNTSNTPTGKSITARMPFDTKAYESMIDLFCKWFQRQDPITQFPIITYSVYQHGYSEDLDSITPFLYFFADMPDERSRVFGKLLLFCRERNKQYRQIPAGDIAACKRRLHDGKIIEDILRRAGASTYDPKITRLTSEQAAAFLGMSRATLFRKAESPTFRRSLDFKGTNTRNGRYSLERVLDSVIESTRLSSSLIQ